MGVDAKIFMSVYPSSSFSFKALMALTALTGRRTSWILETIHWRLGTRKLETRN
jgi:hypothetical protein